MRTDIKTWQERHARSEQNYGKSSIACRDDEIADLRAALADTNNRAMGMHRRAQQNEGSKLAKELALSERVRLNWAGNFKRVCTELSALKAATDAQTVFSNAPQTLTDECILEIGLGLGIDAFTSRDFRYKKSQAMTLPEREDIERQFAFARAIERHVAKYATTDAQARDAARYRAIRDIRISVTAEPSMKWTRENGSEYMCNWGVSTPTTNIGAHETLDDAIDAAIAAKEAKA